MLAPVDDANSNLDGDGDVDNGVSEEAQKYLRLQVARWKSTVGEIEELMEVVNRAEGQCQSLMDRCRPNPKSTGPAASYQVASGSTLLTTNDLATSQEAMIRSRVAASRATVVAPKTRQDRQKELLELRHELAKCSEEIDGTGQEQGPNEEQRSRAKSTWSPRKSMARRMTGNTRPKV
eukprot:gnl/TRDRNA2_/TRDRNA2_203340_c0_seq1.p1 gnl/TRDRNA2_/TRDRNA2_203340_c0~~gnl/TRDRNA2_/TRDRNA2_203340_c0_seq1.p1  ORF type:complete len:178 (-),score=28.23 gnl/TRDRNA2_/TRDRNA2_203340_c0_seq1:5-538(-)